MTVVIRILLLLPIVYLSIKKNAALVRLCDMIAQKQRKQMQDQIGRNVYITTIMQTFALTR